MTHNAPAADQFSQKRLHACQWFISSQYVRPAGTRLAYQDTAGKLSATPAPTSDATTPAQSTPRYGPFSSYRFDRFSVRRQALRGMRY